MSDITAEKLLGILRSEICLATGCTEIAAAALVAAKAAATLGQPIAALSVTVSPNIFKNGAWAGVPGTPLKGLAAAAALGAIISRPEDGLRVLSGVDAGVLASAKELLAGGSVRVTHDADSRETVYLKAVATATDGERATAIIQGSHDHFVEVSRDDRVLLRESALCNGHDEASALRATPVSRLLALVDDMSLSDLGFLIEAVEVTMQAVERDLKNPDSRLGPTLNRRVDGNGLAAARSRAQALSGAASEARMTGGLVPVMAITGSGNHGIANFLGVYGFALSLGASHERLARALAIASIVTVCVKAYTGKLTAFCGCAIAPATGLAAAAVDLLGGDATARDHAMQSVVGVFAGLLCDGAKESCAFKVSTAVGAAIDIAVQAVDGAFVPDNNGMVGATIDETFARLARLNDPGMRETERVILEFIAPAE